MKTHDSSLYTYFYSRSGTHDVDWCAQSETTKIQTKEHGLAKRERCTVATIRAEPSINKGASFVCKPKVLVGKRLSLRRVVVDQVIIR